MDSVNFRTWGTWSTSDKFESNTTPYYTILTAKKVVLNTIIITLKLHRDLAPGAIIPNRLLLNILHSVTIVHSSDLLIHQHIILYFTFIDFTKTLHRLSLDVHLQCLITQIFTSTSFVSEVYNPFKVGIFIAEKPPTPQRLCETYR